MNPRLLGVVALVAILAVWALPPAPAVGQDPQLPCPVTANRTVNPLSVAVGGTVHVSVTLQADCAGGAKAIDAFFVVDRSVTMIEDQLLQPTQDALIAFVNAMNFPASKAGVITYAANESISRNLTGDRDAIIQAINAIRLSQETDVRGLQGAFRTATQKLDGDGTPGNEKVIFIVAAGADTAQALLTMPTVTQAARNAGMKVIFLMFPDARFTHYVDASSDCDEPWCPAWQGPRGAVLRKWAWGVEESTMDDVMRELAARLLRLPTLDAVTVSDSLNFAAEYVVGSASPPFDRPEVPPYEDLEWDLGRPPAGGATVSYDVRMTEEGEYPVAVLTRAFLTFSTGPQQFILPLPNPAVRVSGAVVETPTSTPFVTRPTDTPTAPVDTPAPTMQPSATATDAVDRPTIFLPAALRGTGFGG